MSSKPVVIKLACDSKEAQTNHVRSKLSEILKVYLENIFPEYYPKNLNIGPFKYRFRLSIFQINYSIDNIDYRLPHGLILATQRSIVEKYTFFTLAHAEYSLHYRSLLRLRARD
jgi:hypothetical protein